MREGRGGEAGAEARREGGKLFFFNFTALYKPRGPAKSSETILLGKSLCHPEV